MSLARNEASKRAVVARLSLQLQGVEVHWYSSTRVPRVEVVYHCNNIGIVPLTYIVVRVVPLSRMPRGNLKAQFKKFMTPFRVLRGTQILYDRLLGARHVP